MIIGEKNKTFILLLIILAIAAFFRLWSLDFIPPGLYPDEAMNANEAIISPGQVFYPENNGREGLFINLITLSFSIFGASIWSLRFVSAIFGTLTVLGLYFLTKELLSQITDNKKKGTSIALLSSFFLAVSFWYINFSRIAFRGILVPFILVFGFYFLFKGFRTQKISNFIVAGIFFGLGFYTYISYRFIVLLLLIVLISFWFIYRKQNLQKKFLLSVFCFLFSILLTALPIGIYFIQNPQDFVGRAAPISIFAAENPIEELSKSLVLHLAMFNFYGDPNWRHNFAGSPQLLWPIGILFLIGLATSIKDLCLIKKEKKCFMLHASCFMLSWLFIMLLPGILTYEGVPHALRTIGVIPVAYIFSALGGNYLYDWLNTKIENKKLFTVLCSLFIVSLAFGQFYKYYFCWAKNPEVEGAFSKDYVELGNYLNSISEDINKYVIVNQSGVPVPWPDGVSVAAQTPMFIERTKSIYLNSTYVLPEKLNEITINERTAIIVPMRYEESLFNELREKFPQGHTKEENGILIYIIP